MTLVLSIFSGIDLLGLAFRREDFCVVSGGDVLWGAEWDVRGLHPPAGTFAGVIGGPPCQAFSILRHLIKHNGHKPRFGNMIPEFERVVAEAQPDWFVMENVRDAPVPHVEGYETHEQMLKDIWVGGVQPRARRISFGTRDGRPLDIQYAALMRPEAQGTVSLLATDSGIAYEEKRRAQSVLAGHGSAVPVKRGGRGRVKRSVGGDARIASTGDRVRSKELGAGVLPSTGKVLPIEDACEAMGLPRNFTDDMPFTMHGKRSAIGNGVPLAMGKAIALAVRRALG